MTGITETQTHAQAEARRTHSQLDSYNIGHRYCLSAMYFFLDFVYPTDCGMAMGGPSGTTAAATALFASVPVYHAIHDMCVL